MIAMIVSSLLVLGLLVESVVGTFQTRQTLERIEVGRDDRVQYYRQWIVDACFRAVVALLVAFSAGLGLTDLGLTTADGLGDEAVPDGAFLAWFFTALMVISMAVGSLRRKRMRPGRGVARAAWTSSPGRPVNASSPRRWRSPRASPRRSSTAAC
jgi:hypothetical protein